MQHAAGKNCLTTFLLFIFLLLLFFRITQFEATLLVKGKCKLG